MDEEETESAESEKSEESAQAAEDEVGEPMAEDPTGILDAQQQAVQAALQGSQEQAVRACLGALDPTTRTDEGTYVEALQRLQTVCQTHIDRLTAGG